MGDFDDESIFKRELPIAPERALAIAFGAMAIVLGGGIQLGLKTIDEVAIATFGFGLLVVVAGVAGSRRFSIWIVAAFVLLGALVFGAGVNKG